MSNETRDLPRREAKGASAYEAPAKVVDLFGSDRDEGFEVKL